MKPPDSRRSGDSCIGVLISGFADRREVLNTLIPLTAVHLCDSLQDLRVGITNGRFSAVICECRDSFGLPLGPSLASESTGSNVPTLVFLRPTPADVSFFSHLVLSGVPALARVTGQADIGDVVRSVIKNHWSPEANAPIIRQIAKRFAGPLEVILALAIIAGSRRLGVGEFAQLARVSERTLQRRLAIAGFPPVSRLLSQATTLHSAWRLEMRGDRIKEVVAASGFLTREAFTSFIGRHASCTVSALSRQGAFLHMLDAFLAELPQGMALHGHSDLRPLTRIPSFSTPRD